MNKLTCNTCEFHHKQCDSSAYEGREGYVVGEDWCELYKKSGGRMKDMG